MPAATPKRRGREPTVPRARILELAEKYAGDTAAIAREVGVTGHTIRALRREFRKQGKWPWENHWRGTPAVRVPQRTADLPLWPGKNRWDVTDLRADMQAREMPDPVVRWGEIYRGATITGGTHHFYIDDFQFSGLWRYPSKLPTSNCAVAIEPNYSAGPRGVTPAWQVLQGIAYKRWLARYWQECGVRIVVDLNVHRDWWDLALLGVPRGWASYATRVHADEPDAWGRVEDTYDLAVQRAGTEGGLFFVVFGGGEATRRRCISNGWLWHRSTRVWRKPRPGKLPPTFVPPEHERHVHRMPPKPPPGLFDDPDVSTLDTVDSTPPDESAEAADSEE